MVDYYHYNDYDDNDNDHNVGYDDDEKGQEGDELWLVSGVEAWPGAGLPKVAT